MKVTFEAEDEDEMKVFLRFLELVEKEGGTAEAIRRIESDLDDADKKLTSCQYNLQARKQQVEDAQKELDKLTNRLYEIRDEERSKNPPRKK